MTIKKSNFFIFMTLLFFINKMFCTSPSQNAELEFSLELKKNKTIKVCLFRKANSYSKELQFYEQKNKGPLTYIGTMETLCLEEGQFEEGFQDIYQDDNFLVIQQSFGDGRFLVLSRLYFIYEKRKKIKLVKYSEQHIDRFSEEKDFTEIEYEIPKNIYVNDISSNFIYELHKSKE